MKQSERQKSVLSRLEKQLKSGVKPVKGKATGTVELSPHDIKRIEKEITTLETKLKKAV